MAIRHPGHFAIYKDKEKSSMEVIVKQKNIDLLSGWQEIADYLDKSIRTVQRWKRTRGLPIHHPAGLGSTPHASKKDFETWIFRRSENEDRNASLSC